MRWKITRHLPPMLFQLAAVFKKHSYACYLVGGSIRDILLNRPTSDFDLATDAAPEAVRKIFKTVIPTGIKHGTVTVIFRHWKFEVTTFRLDGIYEDGRRPQEVTYTADIGEDLKRRDFTINAMAFNLENREFSDPFHGLHDLRKKIIKAVGDPAERFAEDGLRPLRACRLAAQLNFALEPHTQKAIPAALFKVKKVSAERIRDELVKIIQSANPFCGFEEMRQSGILKLILPELSDCIGLEQRERHRYDVYCHSLAALSASPRDNLTVRLAALLHDIGKPQAYALDGDNQVIFHKHEEYSAQIAQTILTRLKFSNQTIERVRHLITHHMFNYSDEWKDATVRRFIRKVGKNNLNDLVLLRRADQIGINGRGGLSPNLKDFLKRAETISIKDSVLSLNELKVKGDDLISQLSIKPGPLVGVILEQLLETVIDDPSQNTKDRLLKIAMNFYQQNIKKS